VPKPVKLLEGIGNGALIWSTAILWTNDQHFILLRCIRVYGKLSPESHILCMYQCYFSCCFSVSVKVLDHKFFQLLL